MVEQNEIIPYFIQMRGCINCDASKEYKKRHGSEYGFDHELMIRCLLTSCYDEGHSLTNPFFDPEEILRLTKRDRKKLDNKQLENIRAYLENIKKIFGEYYTKIGVSIDKIIEEI